MRLVEHDGDKIGVFNCDGTLYAIEDRCSHDDGPLAEGEFDAADLHGRVPPSRLPLRPRPPAGRRRFPPMLRCDVPGAIEDDTIILEVD